MNNIEVIKNYRDNARLRASFNELAKKTFWIDFEDWYQNGYWTERYNPYSIVMDGKVAANVSVNLTDFEWNGAIKHFIQLGTVMADESYRNQGLIHRIMEEIEADYADKLDGMYLFANNDVLDFYPKFGFQTAKQYEYVKELTAPGNATARLVSMNEKAQWDKLEQIIKNGYKQSVFEMNDNSELNMFYVSKYMQENVYYCKDCDAYVVAEIENDKLVINMVISDKEQDLNHIAECFGKDIRTVILGFTPKNAMGFAVREMDQDDQTLYIKGNGWSGFEEDKLMFPLLAHA